jgi:hypothetical protein
MSSVRLVEAIQSVVGWAHLEHVCMLQGGFCLEKKAAACTCKSVMKDNGWKTDLWAAPCCIGARVAVFG